MNSFYSVILIIPCYNEAKRIDVGAFKEFMANNKDFLIFFVNDGSSDNTKYILESEFSTCRNFRMLSLEQNKGKSETIRTGIRYCCENFVFDYIGFADADLATPLGEFISFKNQMEENGIIEIVLGSRVQMLGKNIQRNLYRHWFGRVIATGIGKVLNEPVYDSQCGAKLFKKEIAKEVFEEIFISKWLFDVEILSRYKIKYGSKIFRKTIIEIPLTEWTEKQDSKIRYHHFFRILYDLFKIKRKYFSHK